MNRILLFLFLIQVLSACQNGLDEELLHGEWKGTSIQEEGTPLPVDPAEISFSFRSDNLYEFKSTLNYKEAGSYYLDDVYLYTTDTFNQASTEKVVEVIMLNADSLHLKMKEQEKMRVLKLERL